MAGIPINHGAHPSQPIAQPCQVVSAMGRLRVMNRCILSRPPGREGLPFFPFGFRILCFNPAMQPRITALLMILAAAMAPAVIAGGKAETKVSLSLHMETDANDNPKMIFAYEANGQTRYFRRMPEITTKDVVAFNPFPSVDGGDDYGIVFQLKGNAVKRFAAITNASQGRLLLSQINGRAVDRVLIDKQIDDGFVVVWKGATLADIHLFDAAMPRIGQEGKKSKKKKS